MSAENTVDAYEQFKNEFNMKLIERCGSMSVEMSKKVLEILDICATDYSISVKSQDLSLVEDGMPEVVRIYLAIKRTEGLSELTLKLKFYRLKAFFNVVRKPITMITANDIRAFLFSYQERHGISNATLDGFRTVICCFFRWAAAEGYIDKDPTIPVKPIRFEYKQRNSLTQIELEYIRMACIDKREKAMIEFYYSTGCRVSEMGRVKIDEVNFVDREVTLFGKGSKSRTSYINARAKVALQDYLQERKDDCPYLFCTTKRPYRKLTKSALEKIVRIICDRVGDKLQKHVTPHVFRHTTATQAVINGMPVNEVQKLLGHSTIATTMVYVETNKQEVKNSHARAIV